MNIAILTIYVTGLLVYLFTQVPLWLFGVVLLSLLSGTTGIPLVLGIFVYLMHPIVGFFAVAVFYFLLTFKEIKIEYQHDRLDWKKWLLTISVWFAIYFAGSHAIVYVFNYLKSLF